jgi:hypothetical protein
VRRHYKYASACYRSNGDHHQKPRAALTHFMHTSICTECSHYHAAESGRFVGSLTPSAPLKLSLFARDGGKMMDALCYSAHTETDSTDFAWIARCMCGRLVGCWGAYSPPDADDGSCTAIELRKSTDGSGSPVQSFRRALQRFYAAGQSSDEMDSSSPSMPDGGSNLGRGLT